MLTSSVNRGSLRLRAAVTASPARPPRKRLTPALAVALVAHIALVLLLAVIPLRRAYERFSFTPNQVNFTFVGLAAPGNNPQAGGRTPLATTPKPVAPAAPAPSMPFVRSMPKPVEPLIAVVVKDIPVTRVITATPPPLPIAPADSFATANLGDTAQGGSGTGTGTGVGDGSGPGSAGIGGTGPGGSSGTAIAQPDYLHTPKPHYPSIARQAGWEGTTLLRVEVRKDGTTGLVEVLESSGHQVLDEAARESVRAAKFQPARSGGAPTNSWVEVPISFRLNRG